MKKKKKVITFWIWNNAVGRISFILSRQHTLLLSILKQGNLPQKLLWGFLCWPIEMKHPLSEALQGRWHSHVTVNVFSPTASYPRCFSQLQAMGPFSTHPSISGKNETEVLSNRSARLRGYITWFRSVFMTSANQSDSWGYFCWDKGKFFLLLLLSCCWKGIWSHWQLPSASCEWSLPTSGYNGAPFRWRLSWWRETKETWCRGHSFPSQLHESIISFLFLFYLKVVELLLFTTKNVRMNISNNNHDSKNPPWKCEMFQNWVTPLIVCMSLLVTSQALSFSSKTCADGGP